MRRARRKNSPRANEKFVGIKRGMYHNMAGFHSVTRLFDGLMYILVVVLGAIYMINGQIAAEDLVAYLLYVADAARPRFAASWSSWSSSSAASTGIERFNEVMAEPVAIADRPGAREMGDVRGEIAFEHVSFSYAVPGRRTC